MGFLGDLALGVAPSIVNAAGSFLGMNAQANKQKELLDYQWNKMYSPQAQVANLGKAGINPAVAFGNSAPVISGSSMPSLTAPSFGIGTTSLSDLASYISAIADAKKKGVEVPNIEADTRIKTVEADTKKYELELQKYFAAPERATALGLAWQDVMLKQDEHSINEWTKAKEKAMSEAKENERDILKKELDNMDTKLGLQNELLRQQGKTEQAKQSEFSASAEQHRTQADVNRENRRLQAALADVEESTKTDKIASLISKYHADGAISDADYSEAMLKLGRLSGIEDKRSTPFFREVDNFTDWLKSKISIFK